MAEIIVNGFPVQAANYKVGKSHNPQSWNILGLYHAPIIQDATVGAGLTGSTVSGSVVLPQFCKIPKVAVAFKSSNLFDGTETFNIVVEAAGDGTPAGEGSGYGASYTAGQVQSVGFPDNSVAWGYPAQSAPQSPPNSGLNAGPVFFPVGACLFANDVPFSVETFTSGSASGGVAVLATTNYDGVFAAGTLLSVRFVTTASTGSITGLCISLEIEQVDALPSEDSAVPITGW